jgi:cellulose synthase/poly-beta-1,6-N-acetylglucosamine synthase-like glycosyltransferase
MTHAQPTEQPSTVSAGQDQQLAVSIDGLREAAAGLSAHTVLTGAQRVVIGIVAVVLAVALLLAPFTTLRALVALATAGYAASLIYRILLFKRGLSSDHLVDVSDEEALAMPDADLPVYTVLVPAYREPHVISKVVAGLAALHYPAHKLDVKLLLEADDIETVREARTVRSTMPMQIVLVPPAEPRTKPKACNYGLQLAEGELVTIYDAEDLPEPLQLRRAVVALRRLGAGYACVQAQLAYFNSTQNRITKWFAVEYGTWFKFLLPGLASVGAPIPLGGTSNHFRTDLLRAVGAWDPYNVTEDADLGIRLARLGYSVGVLASVTEEEANSDFVNWIKQRSRWYKGYLQTWLVHVRTPRILHRELGWRGAIGLHLFVAGTPLITLINPLFWALALIWFVGHPAWVAQLFPAAVFYVAMTCLVVGNAAVVYMSVLTTRLMRRPDLLGAALLSPVYWLMMSAAAAKAAVQLVLQPSYWEKTTHGLQGVVHPIHASESEAGA